MTKKSSSKKIVYQCKEALDKKKMEAWFEQTTSLDWYRMDNQLQQLLFKWFGNPTAERIAKMVQELPLVNAGIEIAVVQERLLHLDQFEGSYLGVDISEFMPELLILLEECNRRITLIDRGVEKANLWLIPIAEQAGADASLEAAIYFSSRGKAILDTDAVNTLWYTAICKKIVEGFPLPSKLTEDVKRRAAQRQITISEAAAVLSLNEHLPNFFSYSSAENEFIDSTFFRGVQWFKQTAFEPWVASIATEVDPQSISADGRGAWSLFYLCRSDLMLSRVSRVALESFCSLLSNGTVERSKPWRLINYDANLTKYDFIPMAAALIFALERIEPVNSYASIIKSATELLFGTQLTSGAWPLYTIDTQGHLMTTCIAIHALAITRPEGWEHVCQRAKQWLILQQENNGCWHVSGGPTVMITTLVMDAIDLADGHKVTFAMQAPTTSTPELLADDPNYDYSSQTYHNPDFPKFNSISLDDALEQMQPAITLVVATEVELKQALYLLKPQQGEHIDRVSYGLSTYYLGKFGHFPTVIVRSTMGIEGPTGATLTVNDVIQRWHPKVVVMPGIAFGRSKEKHGPGDVLIASAVIPYEDQRVGKEVVFRAAIPPSSPVLYNRFINALGWKFFRPDKTLVSTHYGHLLSGSKLVDDPVFKQLLFDKHPTAIGGEMEGSGVYAAAAANNVHWIVVKAVCDWADGQKHKNFQELAAASAMSLCEHVFSDPHALDGI